MSGWYNIRYHYRGTFTIERTHGITYPVMLPRDVTKIYGASQVAGLTDAARNPSTNAIDWSDYYFWYFWDPSAKGCPLKEGVDYGVFQAKVTVTPNLSRSRYPDYPRLVNAAGEIPISIVFGANEDDQGGRAPEGNADINAANFLDIEQRLVKAGFTARRLTTPEVKAFCPAAGDGEATITELSRADPGKTVKVRMFWGSTHPGHHAEGFACVLNHAVQKSAVLVYSAHSGLGESIYLSQLRKDSGLPLVVNPDLYQVFAFNSCSSYGYYNADFFHDKAAAADPSGENNLDVITSGTSTDFAKIAGASWKELLPILEWSKTGKWTSYQNIVDSIDQGTLTGVSGARGNPERPY